jgi:hypothetical protein
MALADPQTITINAVTTPLPRTYGREFESAYTSADGLWKLSLNHNLVKQGRQRHLLRFDHSKIAANPMVTNQNERVSMAVYLVMEVPPPGWYSNTEQLQVYAGFKGLMTASSDAIVTKLIGGES